MKKLTASIIATVVLSWSLFAGQNTMENMHSNQMMDKKNCMAMHKQMHEPASSGFVPPRDVLKELLPEVLE